MNVTNAGKYLRSVSRLPDTNVRLAVDHYFANKNQMPRCRYAAGQNKWQLILRTSNNDSILLLPACVARRVQAL